MDKQISKWITCIFCGFLGLMLLLLCLLPKEDFSPVENRNLQKLPNWSWEGILDGPDLADFEEYISDHVPFRDLWFQLHSTIERLSGKTEKDGVHFGQADTLLSRVAEPDPERIEKNVNYINDFVNDCPVPVYFGLIPTAAEIWADRLPANAPTADEKAWIDSCYQTCKAPSIDLYCALSEHADEDIYFRTDHHWTSLGAYYGANAILDTMDLPALDAADYAPETVSDDFRGTLWSKAGAWWMKPDIIELWVPEMGITVTSTFHTTPEPGQLYDRSYLEKKDQYSCFLGGNQPLCVIETGADGGKLLLIRDSYADILAPFLTERFREIHLFDLRFNRLDVTEYIAEHEIDAVVILYGFSGFCEDRNLVFLPAS